jgi:hypothetical protein
MVALQTASSAGQFCYHITHIRPVAKCKCAERRAKRRSLVTRLQTGFVTMASGCLPLSATLMPSRSAVLCHHILMSTAAVNGTGSLLVVASGVGAVTAITTTKRLLSSTQFGHMSRVSK